MTYTDPTAPLVTVRYRHGRAYSIPQRNAVPAAVCDGAIAAGHGDYATNTVDCAAATTDRHPAHSMHVADAVMGHIIAAANGGFWSVENCLPMCSNANAAQGDEDVTLVRYDSRHLAPAARNRKTSLKRDFPRTAEVPAASNVRIA